MRKLLEATAQRAITYREGLDRRSVAPPPEAIAALKALDEPLPAGPAAPEDVVALLDRVVSPATMAMAGPRFFGFVIGGSLPATLAANWLVQAWDQNTALANVTPATARVEAVALRWLLDLLGLPADLGWRLRHRRHDGELQRHWLPRATAVLARAGWNVEADGLIGGPPVQVIVGARSAPDALQVTRPARPRPQPGHPRAGRRAGTDARRRAAKDHHGPTIICTQAGNLNTGAFDPVGEICERVAGTGTWVHVDGAIGLWAAAVPALQHLLPGISTADSWSTDAHKWLNVPKDSGLAFVRDGATLQAAMAITAEYLPSVSAERNPVRLHAGTFAARPRRRGLGRAAFTRALRLSRT